MLQRGYRFGLGPQLRTNPVKLKRQDISTELHLWTPLPCTMSQEIANHLGALQPKPSPSKSWCLRKPVLPETN